MNDNVAADPEALAHRIASYLAMKRKRATTFGHDLFGDPGWDIVLDLYVAGVQGRPVSVSSSCIAAGTPPTTGLRWVKQLVRDGLVVRAGDTADGRRSFLSLSAAARAAVEQLWQPL